MIQIDAVSATPTIPLFRPHLAVRLSRTRKLVVRRVHCKLQIRCLLTNNTPDVNTLEQRVLSVDRSIHCTSTCAPVSPGSHAQALDTMFGAPRQVMIGIIATPDLSMHSEVENGHIGENSVIDVENTANDRKGGSPRRS